MSLWPRACREAARGLGFSLRATESRKSIIPGTPGIWTRASLPRARPGLPSWRLSRGGTFARRPVALCGAEHAPSRGWGLPLQSLPPSLSTLPTHPLTQVEEHALHGDLPLHHQVAVRPQAVQDGQDFLRVVQWALCTGWEERARECIPSRLGPPRTRQWLGKTRLQRMDGGRNEPCLPPTAGPHTCSALPQTSSPPSTRMQPPLGGNGGGWVPAYNADS